MTTSFYRRQQARRRKEDIQAAADARLVTIAPEHRGGPLHERLLSTLIRGMKAQQYEGTLPPEGIALLASLRAEREAIVRRLTAPPNTAIDGE